MATTSSTRRRTTSWSTGPTPHPGDGWPASSCGASAIAGSDCAATTTGSRPFIPTYLGEADRSLLVSVPRTVASHRAGQAGQPRVHVAQPVPLRRSLDLVLTVQAVDQLSGRVP